MTINLHFELKNTFIVLMDIVLNGKVFYKLD